MSDFPIRPHHGLCVNFFEGKGYSEGFVENMQQVISALKGCVEVTVVCTSDVICTACPQLSSGCERAAAYDRKVMEICGFYEGQSLTGAELLRVVYEKVIACGRLGEVCSDCRWFGICSKQGIRGEVIQKK